MSVFLVTDAPQAVEAHHRVVVWLGRDHGKLPGKVTVHARTPEDFLGAILEHVQPSLLENFECALTAADTNRAVADHLLERYKYASRQASFDLNTLYWTYKICALQTIQKIDSLPSGINTLDQLENAHRDQACVIIGAGPSLDISSIDPARILTIATTRTARLCLDAGWCPDYIIHIDPGPFEGVLDEVMAHPKAQTARWLIPFQVHSRFTRLPGRTFWFGSRLNPSSIWISKRVRKALRVPLIVSGGSVSCCAFTIAEFMGCSPICLLGQDLSYGGSQKYSTEEVLSDRFSSIVRDDPDILTLPAIRGGAVQTTMDYASYAEWFVTQARHTRRKAINCTPRGVHLPGLDHLPIQKVYARYCQESRMAPAEFPTRPFPKIDPRPFVGRAREVCAETKSALDRGDCARAFELQTRLGHPDSDEYLVTGCTQYEQKILTYFVHLPVEHPKVRRCLDLLADASLHACDLVSAALDGVIDVPPIDDEDVTRRMRAILEINAFKL